MNLSTASKPVSEIVSNEITETIKPARKQKKDGVVITLPPVTESKVVSREVWVVRTTYQDVIESHRFNDEDSAIKFYKSFK
ncbi:MAG: hypothetical protein ACRBCK_10150 [Alphaproteobacteria bacterium]